MKLDRGIWKWFEVGLRWWWWSLIFTTIFLFLVLLGTAIEEGVMRLI